MSTLYVVATPIGNLKDITIRALETLEAADVIACEDTRVTRRVLDFHSIGQKRLIACNAFNEERSKTGIIKLLDEGCSVALVSDAGTPCISDPGARVVEEIRRNGKHDIVPIPGPNAAASALCVAGNIGKQWLFEGFLPKSDGKMTKRLQALLEMDITFVLYESPFRVLKLVNRIGSIEPDRRMMLARELTKIHEETLIGKATEIAAALEKKDAIKGEFCLVVYRRSAQEE